MKFCSTCGQPIEVRVPPGDNLPRAVCTACGTVHYQNPLVVVGCVPEWQGQILLCRRAIEPRHGFWTIPAGFLENGESLSAAAAREAFEEAGARVEIGSLLAVVNLLHARQVHVMFRAKLMGGTFAAGVESLEVGLFEESRIPWGAMAFQSVTYALQRFLEDRHRRLEGLHMTDIEHALPQRS
jgi:ADP-ribose pyrophosphatase YjhB (NUDIX family)